MILPELTITGREVRERVTATVEVDPYIPLSIEWTRAHRPVVLYVLMRDDHSLVEIKVDATTLEFYQLVVVWAPAPTNGEANRTITEQPGMPALADTGLWTFDPSLKPVNRWAEMEAQVRIVDEGTTRTVFVSAEEVDRYYVSGPVAVGVSARSTLVCARATLPAGTNWHPSPIGESGTAKRSPRSSDRNEDSAY